MLMRQRTFFQCLILRILLIRAVVCFNIYCHDEGYDDVTPSDCQYILAHLPSFHALALQSHAGAHATLNPSTPFLPSAQIVHESCTVEFYYNTEKIRSRRRPPTRTGAFQAWARIRDSIIRVISQCVEHEVGGDDSDSIDGTHLVYEVVVWNERVFGSQMRNQMRALGLLESEAEHSAHFHEEEGLFSRAFYEV